MGDVKITVTKKMYGWSKYGGARDGIVKEELDEWYCQFCGSKQVKGLPCYMIPADEDLREYLRACSSCKYKTKVIKIVTYETLLKEVRG